jgi:hypothetical protein
LRFIIAYKKDIKQKELFDIMNKDYFFISKPRCASTHLYEGLTGWDDRVNGGKPYYHLPASDVQHIFKDQYDSSFSFSVIRNPYDLVLSWYNEHRKQRYERDTQGIYNLPIDKWISRGCPTHWKNLPFNPLHQHRWLYNNDQLLVSYLIRIEDYDNGIQYVYDKIKPYLKSDITVESISQTRKNEAPNMIELTEEQKDKLYELFKKDFELFGYSK